MLQTNNSSTEHDPTEQLRLIIKSWTPDDRIDILGIIIDYCQRSEKGLMDVFIDNYDIFKEIFVNESIDNFQCLITILQNEGDSIEEIEEKYKQSFPAVSKLLEKKTITKQSDQNNKTMIQISSENNQENLDNNIIIWQLSDLHFGKLNTWTNDPYELASSLTFPIGMNKEVKPDYIIISGDVTSIADRNEFDTFKTFCKHLSTELWGTHAPHRILVVPGNHEVYWGEAGEADRLARFNELLSDDAFCITPFGSAKKTFKNPNVSIERYGQDSTRFPPFAVVTLEDIGVSVLLLVSSFYSGNIPQEVKNIVSNDISIGDEDLREQLHNLLREDSGHTSLQYLSLLSNKLKKCDGLLNLAVIHHPLHTYGSECATNKHGFAMLGTLWQKNYRLLLHGHLHMFEDGKKQNRSLVPGMTYCIPCTTLSSHTFRESPGFMLHAIDKSDPLKIKTYKWTLSAEAIFSSEQLQLAYLSDLYSDNPSIKVI